MKFLRRWFSRSRLLVLDDYPDDFYHEWKKAKLEKEIEKDRFNDHWADRKRMVAIYHQLPKCDRTLMTEHEFVLWCISKGYIRTPKNGA